MKTSNPTAGRAGSSIPGSLWSLLVAYTLIFWGLAYRKYSLFTGDAADTAIFPHMYWATLHGRFLWHYFYHMCFFGDHGGFILIALLPIYAIVPTVPMLLLLQSAFIAATGIPMFLIARKALQDEFAAICISLAFLLFPTVVSQNVNQIHDTQFIIVFLAFTFWFYYTERFPWFVTFVALSCLGKENIPLTLMMFGVYAAFQRRHWKWVVVPLAISAVAMGLIFKVIMPYYRGNHPYRSLSYFKTLGDTPSRVLTTVFTDPGKVVDALINGQNTVYFIQLIQPLAWVMPFLSMTVIFVLPDLLVNLLSDNVSLKNIRWHYNLTVAVFLFVAAVFGIGKLSAWLRDRYGAARYAAMGGVLLLCLSLSNWVLWLDLNDYRRLPQDQALNAALALVPANASVLVPQTMLDHVADRWHFNTIQHWLFNERNVDIVFKHKYVIIDHNERRSPWIVPDEVIKAYASNPDYQLVFNADNVFVFQRKGEDLLAGPPTEAVFNE